MKTSGTDRYYTRKPLWTPGHAFLSHLGVFVAIYFLTVMTIVVLNTETPISGDTSALIGFVVWLTLHAAYVLWVPVRLGTQGAVAAFFSVYSIPFVLACCASGWPLMAVFNLYGWYAVFCLVQWCLFLAHRGYYGIPIGPSDERCTACGYLLIGNESGICPECGKGK